MSATLLRSSCLCLSTESTHRVWAVGTPGTHSWAWLTCGGSSGVTITLVSFSLRMFLLLLFQGVSPVCHLCSWSIAHPSCALILGSSSGFPMGLVSAGGSPLPLPPLPTVLSLWGVVACDYCLLCWTSQYKILGGCFYQYSRDSSKWCCLPERWVDLGQFLIEYELVILLPKHWWRTKQCVDSLSVFICCW